jgi:hypothetical protein
MYIPVVETWHPGPIPVAHIRDVLIKIPLSRGLHLLESGPTLLDRALKRAEKHERMRIKRANRRPRTFLEAFQRAVHAASGRSIRA